MSVIDTAVVLPKLAFTTAWSIIDAGQLHPVVGTNTHYWMPDESERELHAKTMALLADHGLARRDRINPIWQATMSVVAQADREYYSWNSFTDGTNCSILVAARGRDAVRLVVDDDVVLVEPIAPKWLATHLIDALPEVSGAPIRELAIPQSFYDDPRARSAVDPLAEQPDTSDLDYLTKLLRAPRDAVHQLYTAVREGTNRRRSSPITAIDLADQGRVLTYLTGDEHITLTSGTPRTLVTTLNNTHHDL